MFRRAATMPGEALPVAIPVNDVVGLEVVEAEPLALRSRRRRFPFLVRGRRRNRPQTADGANQNNPDGLQTAEGANQNNPDESDLSDPTPFLQDLISQDLPCVSAIAGSQTQSCNRVVLDLEAHPNDAEFQCPRTGRTPLHVAALRCACVHVLRALDDSSQSLAFRADLLGNTPLHLLFLGLSTKRVQESAALEMLELLLGTSDPLGPQDLPSSVAASRNRQGFRPLHLACAGPTSMIPDSLILRLLDANPSVASTTCENAGQTPLLVYCAQQPNASPEVVERLVASHANFSASDRKGWNCLHYAAQNANAPVIRSLVLNHSGEERQLPLSRTSSEGWTALHILMQKPLSECHLAAIRVLVEVAPEALAIRDVPTASTPLHLLLQSNAHTSLSVVRLLIEAMPSSLSIPDCNQYLPLHIACERGADAAIVALIQDTYPDAASSLTKRRDTALSLACTANQSLETVKMTLQAYPEAVSMANVYGFLPIHCLCRAYQPCLALVQALVAADPSRVSTCTNNPEETAIHVALNNSSVSVAVVHALTAALASCTPESCTLGCGNDVAADGSKVSSATVPMAKVENTPLHLACFRGAPLETIESLIQANPRWMSARNNAGYTPIQILCQSARIEPEAIRLFSRLGGPSVFAVADVMGNTPLHSAMREDTDPQALLLLMRANPEALHCKTIYDDTPLHVACLRKVHPEVVREVAQASSCVPSTALVRSHGRLSPLLARNTAGQTPIGIAMEEFELRCLRDPFGCCVAAEYTAEQQRSFDNLASLVYFLHYGSTPPSSPFPADDDAGVVAPPSLLAACLALHRIDVRLHPAFIRRVLHVQPHSARQLVDLHGNYPLHVEASIPIEKMGILDASTASSPTTAARGCCCRGSCHRRASVLRRLWELHPEASSRANDSDDFPLTLMVQSGRPWDDAFALVLEENPAALHSLRYFDANALLPLLLRRLYDRVGRDAVFRYLRTRGAPSAATVTG